ncbi:DUF5123 domain-containing protein [Belliella marina]|uniref:DUF5123 domain-containing protein n=1 Tax=Belliella marina TaxID=1644146 RepID=A0ABW4VJA1_9BACT
MTSKIYNLAFIVLMAFIIGACVDHETEMNYALPGAKNLSVEDKKARTATVSWEYDQDQVQYFIINLSKEPTFANAIVTDTIGVDIREYGFQGLESLVEYHVRVQSRTGNRLIDPHPAILVFRSAEIESLFLPLESSDINVESVKLTWKAPNQGGVSHIVLTSLDNGNVRTIELGTSEISSRSVVIEGLVSAGNYSAEIFDADENKGTITFTTKDINAAISISGNSKTYEFLQDAIDDAVSGDVIKVGAAIYDFTDPLYSTIFIDGKSLTIEPANTAGDMPEIRFKNFDLKGDIGYLKIKGIKILSNSKAVTDGNTDYNKHMFGVTYVTGTFSLELTDCDLSGAESGLIFSQTVGAGSAPEAIPGSATFGLVVENCLLHDFGNAGGDFIDFRSGAISNILVKNSSFWNGARALFRADADVVFLATATLTLENSTINNFGNGGRFVDLRTNGSVIVRNSIVTNKITNHGNRMQNGASLQLINTNVFGSNAGNITAGATITNGLAVDPQYANAESGNFTVGSAEVKAAGQGDPRWL